MTPLRAEDVRITVLVSRSLGPAQLKEIFAFAAYNAGPNRIRRLRAKAAEQGYDPRIWFQNVEVVVANEVGHEPVQYVSNIFKYYTVYSLLTEQQEIRQQVKQEGSRDG